MEDRLEILGESAVWYASTWRVENGVQYLRDNRADTYWQSDCSRETGLIQYITVHLGRPTPISRVSLFLDYSVDETYTPEVITIQAGHTIESMYDTRIKRLTLVKPQGWTHLELRGMHEQEPLIATTLRLYILKNHMQGKDSHIRQMRVFGPQSIDQPLPVLRS